MENRISLKYAFHELRWKIDLRSKSIGALLAKRFSGQE